MTQPSSVGRRPILSATPPSRTEPIAMPISSIDRTTPSAVCAMPHSCAIPGEAKAIDSDVEAVDGVHENRQDDHDDLGGGHGVIDR